MKVFRSMFCPVWKLADESEGSDGDPSKNLTKMIAAIAVIIVACIIFLVMWRSGGTRGPSASHLAPFIGLGEAAAQETAKLLDNKGRIVVAVNDPAERAGNPELEQEFKAFQNALKQQADFTVLGIETVETSPESTSADGLGGDVYLNLLKKYPDLDAIVSLVGPPVLNNEQARQLPPKFPKFVAVSLKGVSLKELMQAGLVQVAIVKRREPGPAPSQTAPPREKFEQLYQVITTENVSQLVE